MNSIPSIVERHPLTVFFLIAFATSFGGGYLSSSFPSDWWAVFVYGPFIGAFLVTAVCEGRAGLKTWLVRIVRWRVGLQWYAVALLLPVLLQSIAFAFDLLLGAPMPSAAQWNEWPGVFLEFIFILLFIGLAEEPGFRGFALERLLAKHTVIAATIILGVLHVIWHAPLFVSGSEPLTIVPIILAGAFLLTWLYINANRSILLPMLMHASVNTTAGYFNRLLSETDAARHTVILAGVYVATAILVVAVGGPDLLRKSVAETLDTQP